MTANSDNGFTKTLKQIEASRLAPTFKHFLCKGGSRSGKTSEIVRQIIIRASKVQSRHVSLRLNFNHAKTSLWLDTVPKILRIAFPDLKVIPQKTDFYYLFPNGSEYWIGGLDDEKRVEKILGKEYSTIHFNEISQLPYSSVQIALTRLAERNELAKRVYYDMNPPPKSHWSYALFEQGLNPVDHEPIKNKHEYGSILMNPMDNLDNIDQDYIALLQNMSEKDRQRFLEGQYQDDSNGQVYYSFRVEHIVKTEFQPGTIFIFMDFNVSPMTATIGQVVNDEVHCHDEIWLEVGDTYRMVDELHKRGYKGGVVIPDSTGANRKTSGKSDFQILREAGFTIPNVYNPAVSDRVNNVNRLLQANKIKINPKCKKLINDLTAVVWKNGVPDQTGQNKMLTHTSDGLGYGCWKLFPIGLGHRIHQQSR